MLTKRSRNSLVQFIDIFDKGSVKVLLEKHNIQIFFDHSNKIIDIADSFDNISDTHLIALLEEVAKKYKSLHSSISPKHKFDESFSDLSRCLLLDGYLLKEGTLTSIDPSIGDAPALEDDLVIELRNSGLTDTEDIIKKINASSNSFRSEPFNYNNCLCDIRIALESLARSIAETMSNNDTPTYDKDKYGSIIEFLKKIEFITKEEDRGLAGVYGFLSAGSHRSIGLLEIEMARLGRSLALNMCWFLVKTLRAKE